LVRLAEPLAGQGAKTGEDLPHLAGAGSAGQRGESAAKKQYQAYSTLELACRFDLFQMIAGLFPLDKWQSPLVQVQTPDLLVGVVPLE
jgi:hypothetical protein